MPILNLLWCELCPIFTLISYNLIWKDVVSRSIGYYLRLGLRWSHAFELTFISVAYARWCHWRFDRSQLFSLQPSINLHVPVTVFMFSCSGTDLLSKRDVGSGLPCAADRASYNIGTHTGLEPGTSGSRVQSSNHYTTAAHVVRSVAKQQQTDINEHHQSIRSRAWRSHGLHCLHTIHAISGQVCWTALPGSLYDLRWWIAIDTNIQSTE